MMNFASQNFRLRVVLTLIQTNVVSQKMTLSFVIIVILRHKMCFIHLLYGDDEACALGVGCVEADLAAKRAYQAAADRKA